MTSTHRWKFFRAGGVDQVMLRNGADLAHLSELDPKLWVALAMPTKGVVMDPRTLQLLDSDKDGRVRIPEVLEAARWTLAALANPDDLLIGSDSLACDAIRDPAMAAGARRILHNLGKEGAASISLADVASTEAIFASTRFNGDGVVPADCTDDPAVRQVIEEIILTCGAVTDRSGKPGIDSAKVTDFYAQVDALEKWRLAGGPAQVIGAATSTAAEAVRTVRAKVEDFFVRCRLAEMDPRAASALSGSEADFAAMALKELSSSMEDVARLPIAKIQAGGSIPLSDGVNPAWAGALQKFAKTAALPLLGRDPTVLSFTDWQVILAKVAPYEGWMTSRPLTAVEKLGLERVAAIAAGGSKGAIEGLIKKDLELQKESAQVDAVEMLVRFNRDLGRLLRNFVNFSDFYGRKGAVFQAGTLFLDGRGCFLCMEVSDPAKHGVLAAMAGAYLVYCDCTRVDCEKITIVAAFTDGDSDNLLVGRNGVFFDHLGRDWDATITKIIANPISIREAFWSPYKKLVRFVEEQVTKRAAAAEASNDEQLKGTAVTVSQADKLPVAEKPKASKIDVGTVAAIGVAVGGIGAMVTGILSAFFGLGGWMPIGILAMLLLISGPSMLLAYIKLRRRNLGPLLDANGWAINGRARVNVLFGGALTDVAKLPPGAERALKDPYAEKSRPWWLYITLAVILSVAAGWYFGRLDRILPAQIRSTQVLGASAPATQGIGTEKK